MSVYRKLPGMVGLRISRTRPFGSPPGCQAAASPPAVAVEHGSADLWARSRRRTAPAFRRGPRAGFRAARAACCTVCGYGVWWWGGGGLGGTSRRNIWRKKSFDRQCMLGNLWASPALCRSTSRSSRQCGLQPGARWRRPRRAACTTGNREERRSVGDHECRSESMTVANGKMLMLMLRCV
eukprot:scaffold15712_cov84-Isochrysis_galbana.AAC.2